MLAMRRIRTNRVHRGGHEAELEPLRLLADELNTGLPTDKSKSRDRWPRAHWCLSGSASELRTGYEPLVYAGLTVARPSVSPGPCSPHIPYRIGVQGSFLPR
jgi:hypothetical protein